MPFTCARLCLGAAFLSVFLSFTGQARATTMEAMSLADLTSEASWVVVGTVRGRTSEYDEFGRIVTDHRIEVEEVWKSATDLPSAGAQPSELLMRSLGGEVGELAMTVPGAPHLNVGERAIFFLRESALSGAAWLKPVGMAQGVLRVTPVVQRGVPVPTVQPGGQGLRLLKLGAEGSAPGQPALTQPSPLGDVRRAVKLLLPTAPAVRR